VLYLFGTPGQKRFDFMWEILSEGMLGFVVMIDATKSETFHEAQEILQIFRGYSNTPFVIAANKQDQADAWTPDDLRIVLGLHESVKVLPCVARDKESVKQVLLELLYTILETYED
jgi:signal recognition particle receptor subunit beta